MNDLQKQAIKQYLSREDIACAEHTQPEVGDRSDEPAYVVEWKLQGGRTMFMCIEPDGSRHT